MVKPLFHAGFPQTFLQFKGSLYHTCVDRLRTTAGRSCLSLWCWSVHSRWLPWCRPPGTHHCTGGRKWPICYRQVLFWSLKRKLWLLAHCLVLQSVCAGMFVPLCFFVCCTVRGGGKDMLVGEEWNTFTSNYLTSEAIKYCLWHLSGHERRVLSKLNSKTAHL